MMKFFDLITPELVWGLFPRLLGLVYLVAIGSLFPQGLPLAGSRGISPIKSQLTKIHEDFPSIKRFIYFPTLLWISSEDWFLRVLVILGAGAGLAAVYGGAFSGWALLICWLVYLSFDLAIGLYFSWDCLLLEAGFLALFLSPIHTLPDLATTAVPLSTLAWAFRWLIFRVLFGFGKLKFVGTNRKEFGYLKGFLINQPMPTVLGWYAHHLPAWVHKVALTYLFFVEMIIPFLIFIPGDLRILAALAIVILMIGIQLTGNFGFFNVIVVVLSIEDFEKEED